MRQEYLQQNKMGNGCAVGLSGPAHWKGDVSMNYQCKDFSADLRKCTVPWSYIWVNSGYSTCAPLKETVLGVKGCFAPPFAAGDTELSFTLEADRHSIEDTGNKGKEDCGLLYAGGTWQPDKILRKGTYHYMVGERLISLKAESELVPLYGQAGFLIKVRLRNRTGGVLAVKLMPRLQPGHPGIQELGKWDFMPPAALGGACRAEGKGRVSGMEPLLWENESVRITLIQEQAEKVLSAGQILEARFAVVFTRAGVEPDLCPQQPCKGGQTLFQPCEGAQALLQSWERTSIQAWERRMERTNHSIPRLESNIPGLEMYYRRSLISGLVCLWENEQYVTNPFPATSGMDGGSICCYPWDVAGYSARTLVMLLGEQSLSFLNAMLDCGIDRHICMSLNGEGSGWCSYAYSMWSLLNLYWTVMTMTGKGQELFGKIKDLFEAEEQRLEEWEHLKDYGRQHNLLEMRTCGYEYYVPSPNAERAWCYDRLADLWEFIKGEKREDWRAKAQAIRESVRRNLWDGEAGWFKALHPGNHVEYVYSIQDYDVMRMGICDEEMKKAMLSHVADGKFLGSYGVNSISPGDELHYELNDPDWSGGGCYSGDGPELAETLWKEKEPALALEVLSRHFWMGTMAPYIPQEHYCDRPQMPENKRANIIAGVSGMQAVLFGMLGLEPTLDGHLVIDPRMSEKASEMCRIEGYHHRGHIVDLEVSGTQMSVSLDGKEVYNGGVRRLEL